jgi:hypothetical protein
VKSLSRIRYNIGNYFTPIGIDFADEITLSRIKGTKGAFSRVREWVCATTLPDKPLTLQYVIISKRLHRTNYMTFAVPIVFPLFNLQAHGTAPSLPEM